MSTISVTDPLTPTTPGERPPSKLSQLEQLLKQGRTLLQDLRLRLEQTTRERDELAATLKERDAAHEKLWAEQAELQRAESERHESELSALRAELGEAIAARNAAGARRDELESELNALQGVRSELDAAVASSKRLADELREAEAHRTSLEKALATAIDDVEQLRSDADRAAALAREIFETHQK